LVGERRHRRGLNHDRDEDTSPRKVNRLEHNKYSVSFHNLGGILIMPWQSGRDCAGVAACPQFL